jgi:hypothetical protein
MTNAPLHKNQAGQPSENGGHFAAAPKEEAPEGLLATPEAPAASPIDRFNIAAANVYSAQEALLDTAPSVIRELIQNDAPSAVSAAFTYDYNMDGDRKLTLESVIDRSGSVIDLSDEVEGDISFIGNSFEDIDDVAQRPDFVRVPGTATQFTLDLTAADTASAASQFEAVRNAEKFAHAATLAAAPAAMRALLTEASPAAATATFDFTDDYDTRFFRLDNIYDAKGNRIGIDYSVNKAVNEIADQFVDDEEVRESPAFGRFTSKSMGFTCVLDLA